MVTDEIASIPPMRCCERRPIALPLAGVPGALLLSVGDVATVTVQVSSMLPAPLQLRGLALRLTLLQETSGALFEPPPPPRHLHFRVSLAAMRARTDP